MIRQKMCPCHTPPYNRARATDVILQCVNIDTPACLHSATSMARISFDDPSQNSCPGRLLVIGDAMFLNQRNEIPLCIPAQGGNTKVRVGGDEACRFAMQIREVTAATTRHEYFLPILLEPSSTATRRPRLPAAIAHMSPAAPPPTMMTSKSFTGELAAPARPLMPGKYAAADNDHMGSHRFPLYSLHHP